MCSPSLPPVGDPVAAVDDPSLVDNDWIRHGVERLIERGDLVPVGDDNHINSIKRARSRLGRRHVDDGIACMLSE